MKVDNKNIVIVETKGQKDLDVPPKMNRLKQWCDDINNIQSQTKFDYVYVDEESFDKYKPKKFRDLLNSFKEYK